jgi:hypothetical protein
MILLTPNHCAGARPYAKEGMTLGLISLLQAKLMTICASNFWLLEMELSLLVMG